ncbi:HIRAN domain-containing protein [Sphingomonas sp. PB2P19]|uniref:HIRAN domain-containing protein n=1 Tax=Sphingomonas rhamnosi TaxID=3096156 RepID=UPI002FC99E78
MDELTTSIVGIDFPNPDKSKSNRRMEIMLCAAGDPVELRPEPTNEFDSNAIAVWSERGVQMGYISAERAPLIGKRMQGDDVAAVFQGLVHSGAYIRLRFGGGLPTLPPAPAEPQRAPPAPRSMGARPRRLFDPHAFYPDEEGPQFGA